MDLQPLGLIAPGRLGRRRYTPSPSKRGAGSPGHTILRMGLIQMSIRGCPALAPGGALLLGTLIYMGPTTPFK